MIDKLKRISKNQLKTKDVIKEAFGKEMKFDVVIGNPPYQDNTASIYPKFINFSLDISTKVCMITRNNWLKSDTLREVRNKMILTGITDIVNYPKIGDIFKGLGVAVSIFNIDKQHYTGITKYTEIDGKQDYSYNIHLEENGIILRNRLDNGIYQKIKLINSSNGAFSDHVLPTEPFRLTSSGYVGRGDNAYELDIYIDKDNEHDVEVWRMEKSGKPFGGYCKTSDVPSRSDIIDTYKVLCGGRLNNNGIVITNIRPIEKHSICDSSWAVIYYDEDANKTLNAVKYIKTKLFRFLVLLFCDDGMTNISPYRFSLVPLQDFTSQSDINWQQSIQSIDKQLYKKYNLTQDEINYIERTIKSIQ